MKVRKCLYRKRRNFCWRNAGCSCRNKKQRAANGADSTDIAQEISDADALIGSLVVPPVGDGFLAPGATSTVNRRPSRAYASALKITRPVESVSDEQPQLKPAWLIFSAMVSHLRFTLHNSASFVLHTATTK